MAKSYAAALERQSGLVPEQFHDAAQARRFMFAGKARFTVRSEATGRRFTFKIDSPDQTRAHNRGKVFFCSLLNGSDNESSYVYFGQFFGHENRGLRYVHGKHAPGRPSRTADSSKAFAYVMMNILDRQRLPPGVELWHEGRCGRCGRPLTVPASIESGFGPECAGRMGE